MLTITYARDRRTWYGLKLYEVVLTSNAGSFGQTSLTKRRSVRVLAEICSKVMIEDRPYRFVKRF